MPFSLDRLTHLKEAHLEVVEGLIERMKNDPALDGREAIVKRLTDCLERAVSVGS